MSLTSYRAAPPRAMIRRGIGVRRDWFALLGADWDRGERFRFPSGLAVTYSPTS